MRYILFIGFFLFHSQAFSEHYLGCGMGVLHTGIAQADWLENSADDLAMAQCWLQSSPAIAAPGFFKSLPSIHWQAAKPTTFSRSISQDHSKAQSFDLYWSFFRHDLFMVGITVGASKVEQQQKINQDLLWLANNNLLALGQPIAIKQQDEYLGVLIDTRHTSRFFNQISINRHRYQLPLRISQENTDDLLSDSHLKTWQLQVRKNPLGYGLLGYWAFDIGSGEISASSYPSVEALDSPYFINTELILGLQWRHRVSNNLHPYIDINGRGSYWYFSKSDSQTYSINKAKQLNYQASVGLSWKL